MVNTGISSTSAYGLSLPPGTWTMVLDAAGATSATRHPLPTLGR
ncbi:hypothetical protein [Streptomyces misionensis]|nr:hypothetical protein [Streptomyces misionensis]